MRPADKFINRVAPALRTVIGAIRDTTARLGPGDDWVEGLKRRVALKLHPVFNKYGRPLVFECHDDDFYTTAYTNSDAVEVALSSQYQRNLTSTRKYRTLDGARDWANGSWVYDPADTDWQHHVYLFDTDEGETDVYGHKEKSAEKDPVGHVLDTQTHGDPDVLTAEIFDKFSIKYDSWS